MNSSSITALSHPADDFTLDASYKGFPLNAAPSRASAIGEGGWNLYAGDLAYPVAALSISALQHNLHWMQSFAKRKGVALAPHAKTTMSPALMREQLQCGAWGLTFATVFQAQFGVRAGAQRIIIANQVLSHTDLDSLAWLLQQNPNLRVWFLVDSLHQLHQIENWHDQRSANTRFDVLLEVGIPGQRTGCRSHAEAMTLAHALHCSRAVRLGGIECYEGGLARCQSDADSAAVTELVTRVQAIAQDCAQAQLFSTTESILITAGGSAVFDLVVPLLRTVLGTQPMLGVLRSGCYVTHDHGNYARFLKLLEQRENLPSSLTPALEVWTLVQSVPEPGLALLNCGRRDISYDLEMPIPLRIAPYGAPSSSPVPADWRINALNDHHAYLRFDSSDWSPQPGDRIVLGISHPCTTFDKWRWLPLVADNGDIQGAVETFF